MVEIRQVSYLSSPDAPYGLELLSFARLRAMGPEERRTAPQRPEFHVVGVVQGGVGHHTVDFVRHPLQQGSVFWIRPGVVHRFDGVEQVEGLLVLFRPDFLPPGTVAQGSADDPFGPVAWHCDEPLARLAAEHLMAEYDAGAAGEILRSLLAVLITRLLPFEDVRPRGAANTAFLAFRAAVEEGFASSHRVSDYAHTLGYSPRTLTRATLAATGMAAKEFLDQRVLLEAKRLLAHSTMPAADCARHLGFDDASNFTKFFRQRTGQTPAAFRTAARGT